MTPLQRFGIDCLCLFGGFILGILAYIGVIRGERSR